MPEFDSIAGEHEVIESAEALFRHLYEAHGVEEAGDLDPDLTAVEPWLRRHAELERASRRSRREQRDDPRPEPPAARRGEPAEPAEERAGSRGDGARPQAGGADRPDGPGPRLFDQQRLRPGEADAGPSRAAAAGPPQSSGRPRPGRAPSSSSPSGQGPDSRQGSGFRDPLVRALAAELFRGGHDERAVRRYIHRYVALTPDGGLTGEAGIRASFLDPILEIIAEQLQPAGRRERISPRPAPATGGTGGTDGPSAEEVQEDLMAIANVVRRRQTQRTAI